VDRGAIQGSKGADTDGVRGGSPCDKDEGAKSTVLRNKHLSPSTKDARTHERGGMVRRRRPRARGKCTGGTKATMGLHGTGMKMHWECIRKALGLHGTA